MRKSLSCFFGLCLVTMVIYISWTQFRNPPPYQFLWHRVNVGVPILLRYIDIQKLLKNARWKIVVITMATLVLSLSIREYTSILGKEGAVSHLHQRHMKEAGLYFKAKCSWYAYNNFLMSNNFLFSWMHFSYLLL